jgi:hypothetical protein
LGGDFEQSRFRTRIPIKSTTSFLQISLG